MHHAGETEGGDLPADKSSVGDEEFVVELSVIDGRRLQGFVYHRRSGTREPVTEWAELTRVITRMLAANQDPAETEDDEIPVGD